MNSLRELGAFCNFTQGVSMRNIGRAVSVLTSAERTSLRAMILALENLPPATLEVEFVGDNAGEVPFFPLFRVLPTKGATLFTIFTVLSQNGEPTPGLQPNTVLGDFVGDIRVGLFSSPGVFHLRVTRTGTGPITLEKTLEFTARAKPAPPQPPVPPLPVTCGVERGQPGFGGTVNMRIFGGGFVPRETVQIIEGGQEVTRTDANGLGSYTVTVSFVSSTPPTQHVVHALGLLSGRTSNDAGFNV
jgi:hypothetical protein